MNWTLRRGAWLWAFVLVLAVPALLRTVWLYSNLQSELDQLLPRDAPSVRAIDELRRRVGGLEYLAVVVDAGTAERVPAAERFLDDLADRIRKYPQDLVTSVQTGNQEERAFFEKNGVWYIQLEDLRAIQQRIEARRDYEVSRTMGMLLDDSEPPPVDFHDIESRYAKVLGGEGRSDRVRYTDEARHLTVMLIEMAAYSHGTKWARPMLERVRGDIRSLGGTEAYAPGMRWGFAGDAAATVEELTALTNDVSLSSLLVVASVLCSIIIYFGWVHSAAIVLLPVILGGSYGFAIASLPPFRITTLNSNTGFLGAIIIGNGLNSGLILLSRYVEERRAGIAVQPSLVRAVSGTLGSTFAAASAATVAYGSLVLTQFRGFRQFGFIGGFGMILAWGLAFLLIPSLVAWLDRGPPSGWDSKSDRFRLSYWLTRALAKAPTAFFIAAVSFTVVSIVEVAQFREDDVESNLSRLRRRDTWKNGEGYWGQQMNLVLGRYLTPFVFLADRPEDAREVAARLRQHQQDPALAGHIDRIHTIWDVLPADAQEKLEVIRQIRQDLTPAIQSALTEEQREYVRRLFSADLHPITVDDLPRGLTLGLRERDGSYDKIVLVFPSTSSDLWHADVIDAIVNAFRRIAAESVTETKPPRIAGSIALSADILDAIGRDGLRVSAYSFTGVFGVVLLLMRRRRATLYVAGALLVGVLWMAGAGRLLHIRLNFANMLAFPITFGIGVDYAVNVVSRYERDGGKDILHAVRSTGAAVALCSLTTILGYSSLLMARNQALFLFGVLADLGEVACLGVALVALPALILCFAERRTTAARSGKGARADADP